MRVFFTALFLFLCLIFSGWFVADKNGLNGRKLFSLLDSFLVSRLEAANPKNFLSEYLNKNAGTCEAPFALIRVDISGQREEAQSPTFPYGRTFALRESGNQGGLADIGCRDFEGRELKFLVEKPGAIEIDRMLRRPLRILPKSAGWIRVSGKDIHFLLISPYGEIEFSSEGNAAITLSTNGDSSASLESQGIIVNKGKVNARLDSSTARGVPQATLELMAEQGAALYWDGVSEPIVEEKSAAYLPSGFIWR